MCEDEEDTVKEGKPKLYRCEAIDFTDGERICLEVVAPTPEEARRFGMESLVGMVKFVKNWRMENPPLRIETVKGSDGNMYRVNLKKLRRGEQYGG